MSEHDVKIESAGVGKWKLREDGHLLSTPYFTFAAAQTAAAAELANESPRPWER